MNSEVQAFLNEEILRHAETYGFAFLLDEEELVSKIRDRFDLNHSEAVWQMTVFIQDNAGPEGDLAVVEKEGRRFYHWRYVKWPNWLPSFVKKPRWHRRPRDGQL